MTGARAEKFVVISLRLLAFGFAITGLLFVIDPNGVLERLDDLGDGIGDFAASPETGARLWLAVGFAFMITITGICLVAQADVVRYRALLLVLAAGKAASSLSALAFYVFDDNVFAYLLNFVVDGSLVLISLWLWSLIGRVGAPAAPP